MPARRLPAMMFYPGDWMKDPGVRSLSLAARGLWMDMLCLMHECPARGYLATPTGKPMTTKQISRMVGATAEEFKELFEELSDIGVCSITDQGCVYSRRMARDEEDRSKNVESGRRGGRARVANQREAEREASTYDELKSDKHIKDIWSSVPKAKQVSKPTAFVAISEALQRKSKDVGGVDHAAAFLKERVAAYYESEQGSGKYARGLIRWLDEDGFDEDASAWLRGGQGGQF